MRAWMLGLAFLFISSVALAQNPKAPLTGRNDAPKAPAASKNDTPKAPANAKNDAQLEKLLRNWEGKSGGIKDMECEFRRITKDKLYNTEDIAYGKASAIRPYRARLDLKDEKGKFTEIYIYTGKRLHMYDFGKKQETIFVLPDPEPGAGQSMPGAFGFLSGMSAADAKSRFNLQLIREFTIDDNDYAEIHAKPRTEADQQDFKLAQIVIDKRTYLPKEIRLIEPNGNEQHWIFDRLETNLKPPVNGKELEPFDQKLMQGWKHIFNNPGEPAKTSDKLKATGSTPSKAQPEAGRPTPSKR